MPYSILRFGPVSADFSPSIGHSLSTSKTIDHQTLSFQQITNPYSSNSFVFSSIQNPRGVPPPVLNSKLSAVNSPVTPLFAASPSVSALTPLSAAFAHPDPGARALLPKKCGARLVT